MPRDGQDMSFPRADILRDIFDGIFDGGSAPVAPDRAPRAIPGHSSHGGGIYERCTNPGGPGTTLGDIQNPELLHESAGSHSGFVLQNVPGLLCHIL